MYLPSSLRFETDTFLSGNYQVMTKKCRFDLMELKSFVDLQRNHKNKHTVE